MNSKSNYLMINNDVIRKIAVLFTLILVFPLFTYGQKNDKELNILLFGHSFGVDCTEHLPALAVEAGITNLRVARFMKGNCSIEQRYNFFIEDYDKGYTECGPGNTTFKALKRTFREAVDERAWDVIVFQNSLENQGFYDKSQPWLNKMVKYIQKVQKNKFKNSPKFCWNMFWPLSVIMENSEKEPHRTRMGLYENSSQVMFDHYVKAAKEIAKKTAVKNIIPSGTAIMNLRASDLNTPEVKEFTRDGYHLSKGAGRYAAACVWFEYFLTPVYGVSVVGNSLRLPDLETPVTDENAFQLQQAAVEAVRNPW